MIRATYLGVMIEFDAVPEAVAFARTVALPSFQPECLEHIPPAQTPPRATKPARVAVPTKATRATQDAPMGSVRGQVLSALRARGTATTREIAEDRGCSVSRASASLQALCKKGYCTLAGKTWTAVATKPAAEDSEFDIIWNGTKDAKRDATLVGDRAQKAR